jgi:hypothetical protein
MKRMMIHELMIEEKNDDIGKVFGDVFSHEGVG